jgi:Protein of unknown function (DUF3095)
MSTFYDDLIPFTDFEQVNELRFFQQAPDDWVIVITDIQGSTKAASEGRGKDVNMIGAAVIALISNSFQSLQTPFVFGGDGATLLMPESRFHGLRKSFVGLMQMAETNFNLSLRVGAVNIKYLREQNFPVLVGKYQSSPQAYFAQFLGSGIAKGEELIKKNSPNAILLSSAEEAVKPDLGGLSCRMTPFKSKNGCILALIVKPEENKDTSWIRETFLPSLKRILNNNFQTANPVSRDHAAWNLIPNTLRSEITFAADGIVSSILVVLKVLMANILLKCNISVGGFVPDKYKSELAPQSDFKKFDDNLRMVLDCSEKQCEAIEDLLKQGQSEGLVIYGLHKSESAVITCITRTTSKGEHIHFVDGENCGYTMAAVQTKNLAKNLAKGQVDKV